MSSVWLEVALNGATGRSLQPRIPIDPSEIIEQGIACVEAGAAILHLHAYAGEEAVESAEIYTKIFAGIKKYCDPIIYPTLALGGTLEQRLAPLVALGEKGFMEWTVVDPGSVNISMQLQIDAGLEGILYANPDSHIKAGLELADRNNWRPAYAIYEPGFARLGAAFASNFPSMPKPIYRIMFSDGLLFGTTPSIYALEFYAQHLQQHAPCAPWMISGLNADVTSIVPAALKLGAHLRVGLEDAPFGASQSNLQLTQQAVAMIEESGRSLATTSEIRASA